MTTFIQCERERHLDGGNSESAKASRMDKQDAGLLALHTPKCTDAPEAVRKKRYFQKMTALICVPRAVRIVGFLVNADFSLLDLSAPWLGY